MAKHQYQPLIPERKRVSQKSQLKDWWLGAVALLGWSLLLAAVYIQHNPWTNPAIVAYTYDDFDNRSYECGHTPEEAISKGCHWDPVSFAWLPERCLDRELADELVNHTHWTIHADENGTIPKAQEAFASNQSDTYLTNGNHALHCIYSWLRLHRLLLAGKHYHSGLSLDHTRHCSRVLQEAMHQDLNEVSTTALVILPAC
ncbi:hypothetical protein CLAFUW4_05191 [Fulvia fulva]|uniref:Uncharacterized protein n=1 Tax=Passalora fulva TaxID=5499 RepID=A0A9Q8PI28_PASFU|nr:uncharacterized protein CLAFUR5_11715 [Fulvia fulva]KAK4626585.1 hypothetical protein CLAFUR4_05177 [Fulvia fulva]KAK4627898.1 hypothetical protein CLAFUR0_05183 [Fulvia fulva]UJO22848.1 hypothetical protein CLAFUR5_11715 [Fulvia fulva]WPV13322.1 hypothetical protein CLAFUW4_05191 [Fulvia fulva]WPV28464.1 hypothetical protein CLAFUW7_05187 [Fulvia fulva]